MKMLFLKWEVSLDRLFTWYVDIVCASLSVCHKYLVSFRSHWTGSGGRNAAAIKWDWGFIHCFLAYNFLFDHATCSGWQVLLQGRFAVLWAEVRWDTGRKELLSSILKDTSHCFYDQDEKEKCWSLRMEGADTAVLCFPSVSRFLWGSHWAVHYFMPRPVVKYLNTEIFLQPAALSIAWLNLQIFWNMILQSGYEELKYTFFAFLPRCCSREFPCFNGQPF